MGDNLENADLILEAWKRSGGKCEYRRWNHAHNVVRCGQELFWEHRGKEGNGRWDAYHIDFLGPDTPANYEILCSTCYKRLLFGH